MPAHKKSGKGFFGDLIKKVAHGGVDFLANKVGLGLKHKRGGALKKGSAEARAKMAWVRSHIGHKKGGSFRASGY